MRIVLSFLIFLIFLLIPKPANALSCALQSPLSILLSQNTLYNYFDHEVVFVGNIDDITEAYYENELTVWMSSKREADITVEKVYKGKIPNKFSTYTYFSDEGKYLFFANTLEDGEIYLYGGGPCSTSASTQIKSDNTSFFTLFILPSLFILTIMFIPIFIIIFILRVIYKFLSSKKHKKRKK